jgi:D-alanyl-D-alanine carboxypeptidase/D-alanyl-D-alanine-endopeptidase (penicillin-binding protein 4)
MRTYVLSGVLIVGLLVGVICWAATKSSPDAATAAAAPASSPAAAPAAAPTTSTKASPPAAPAKAATSAAAKAVAADLAKLLTDPALGKIITSARVVALAEPATREQAELLYDLRPDLPLIPASNMKLFTTAACLDRLGPDWRIRTYVGRLPAAGHAPTATGSDAAGKAAAPAGPAWDLAVIGGGDTNFSARFYSGDSVGAFRQWAEVLKKKGVTSVGRIVLDDTVFEPASLHPHWPVDQSAEWYEAPAGGLNLNDNCVDIHVVAGAKVGEPAAITFDPPGGYAILDGTIATVATKAQHTFSLARIADASTMPRIRIKASGRFWVGAPEAVETRTVADPSIFFGLALAEALKAEGIAVEGPVVREKLTDKAGAARTDFQCDIVHASRLDATVAVANKRSQGFYAECLMKLLGAFGPTPDCANPLPPRQGTWANGADEVRRWMAEHGIPADGIVIDDGSGLSKENRLTTAAVTDLLALMYARHGELFLQSLAVAGKDGSLAKRMRNTPAEGRVFGKTGYVFGASALSGYVRTKSGRMIAYSLLMNDVPWGELWKAKQAEDRTCVRLVDY